MPVFVRVLEKKVIFAAIVEIRREDSVAAPVVDRVRLAGLRFKPNDEIAATITFALVAGGGTDFS